MQNHERVMSFFLFFFILWIHWITVIFDAAFVLEIQVESHVEAFKVASIKVLPAETWGNLIQLKLSNSTLSLK